MLFLCLKTGKLHKIAFNHKLLPMDIILEEECDNEDVLLKIYKALDINYSVVPNAISRLTSDTK